MTIWFFSNMGRAASACPSEPHQTVVSFLLGFMLLSLYFNMLSCEYCWWSFIFFFAIALSVCFEFEGPFRYLSPRLESLSDIAAG